MAILGLDHLNRHCRQVGWIESQLGTKIAAVDRYQDGWRVDSDILLKSEDLEKVSTVANLPAAIREGVASLGNAAAGRRNRQSPAEASK